MTEEPSGPLLELGLIMILLVLLTCWLFSINTSVLQHPFNGDRNERTKK